MTWQDELRQLDEELAAGRLSAEDYRRRRDELLSQSASTSARPATPPQVEQPAAPKPAVSQPTAQQPSPAQPTPPQAAQQPPAQQGNPFPPPFRWDEPPAESTQVMRPIQTGSDSTQVVPPPTGDADRTQVVPGAKDGAGDDGDAERTQVVPGAATTPAFPPRPPHAGPGRLHLQPGQGGPGQAPGGQQFGHAVPPWQQSGGATPPWANSDLPPQTDAPPSWLRQGPESFEKADEGSSTKKILLAVVGVLVVAALGVGAFFVFRPDGASGAQPNPTTTQPAATTTSTTTTTPPPPPEPIVKPDGAPQVDSTFPTVDRLGAAKVLSPEDFAILQTNGVTESRVAVTREGDLVRGTWAFTTPTRASADAIMAEIQTLYTGVGFVESPDVARPGVTVLFLSPPPGTPNALVVYRAHYIGEDKVVRVEAYGPDPAAVGTAFERLLDEQLKQLPADA